MSGFHLHHGDCLEVIRDIPDGSIDCVITDPPYGTTACKWDSVIPTDRMWEELKRVCKPKAAICLFGSQPFSSELVMSNKAMFRHEWIWNKGRGGNFALANKAPMKSHEHILVFGSSGVTYRPEMTLRTEPKDYTRCNYYEAAFRGDAVLGPVKGNEVPKMVRTHKFPESVIAFAAQADECNNVNRVHPTQKPVGLLRYLLRTYTHEGEQVLDFTMGSGSTGVACVLEGRKFIGIEKDEHYFKIAQSRIEAAIMQPSLI